MVVDESQNLRKGLVKIVEQAGMTPWPKPFMALRRSARNELEDSRMFTGHQLEQWFGHSLKVAQQYYLDINPATIKKAAEFGSEEKCQEKCPSGTFTRMQEFLKKVLKPMDFDKFRETVALLKVEEYTHQDSNLKPSVPKTDALSSCAMGAFQELVFIENPPGRQLPLSQVLLSALDSQGFFNFPTEETTPYHGLSNGAPICP